ncbi:hypothetical protein BCR39DRAFT_558075 [Naematelia encephala]|uniref:Protein PBN1 n=1 Tax=Naematelia encephala TaxID=71784 RepID=A0A1Y2BAR0_9TREE|nr:hypothetical protein BCR39DRAFT_558075 [Naematelia encephala]
MSYRLYAIENTTIEPLEQTFHPHLLINLSSIPPIDTNTETTCSQILEISLPDALFLDRDELSDHFAGQSLITYWDLVPSVINIERPVRFHSGDYAKENENEEEGLKLMMELQSCSHGIKLDIPMHGRYLMPRDLGKEEIELFGETGPGHIRGAWVCSEDRPVIDLDLPEIYTSPKSLTLLLPTGHPSHQPLVAIVTAISIWLGFFYLVYKIFRLTRRLKRQKVD